MNPLVDDWLLWMEWFASVLMTRMKTMTMTSLVGVLRNDDVGLRMQRRRNGRRVRRGRGERPSWWWCWWLRSKGDENPSLLVVHRVPGGSCRSSLPAFPIFFLYLCIVRFQSQDHQTASVGRTVHSAWPRGSRAESDPKVTVSHRSLNYFHRHRRRRRTSPNSPCSPAPGEDDQRMNTQPSRIEHPSSLSTDEKNGDRSKGLCDH